MNWFMKVIIYTAVIHTAHLLFDGIRFTSGLVPVWLALFLATVGHFADRWVLPRWGNRFSSVAGGVFMTVTVWGSQVFFPGSSVSFPVAFIIGGILGGVEYRMHRDILKMEGRNPDS